MAQEDIYRNIMARRQAMTFGPILQATKVNSEPLIDRYKMATKRILDICAVQIGEGEEAKELLIPLQKFVKDVSDRISTCIELYLTAQFEKCLNAFADIMKMLEADPNIQKTSVHSKNIEKDAIFYRARVKSEREHDYSFIDMLHIPIESKHLINTYRYSTLGYPSLYLAKSIYATWEEMRRPKLDQFYVSAFKLQNEIKLLDLRLLRDIQEPEEYYAYLKLLPLIVACTLRVKEDDGKFKEEYIISQQVFGWLNQKMRMGVEGHIASYYSGIIYTSAVVDSLFTFLENRSEYELADCIALPTYFPKDVRKGWSQRLLGDFEMTKPTKCDYEFIMNFKSTYLWAKDESKRNYDNSLLSYLEKQITGKTELFTSVLNVILE